MPLIIRYQSRLGYWRGQLLSPRPIVYGGLISYSMYMAHAVVLKFFEAASHKIGMQTQGLRITGAFFFISAVLMTVSAFSHLIEAQGAAEKFSVWA
jgi:peptidoglycan/LPS O-acetylase OafA/YrhL